MLWIDVLETTTGNMIWWGRHGFDKQFQGRVPVCGWKLNWKKKEEVRYLQSGSNKSLVWPLGHELIVSYTLNSCYPNHIWLPQLKCGFHVAMGMWAGMQHELGLQHGLATFSQQVFLRGSCQAPHNSLADGSNIFLDKQTMKYNSDSRESGWVSLSLVLLSCLDLVRFGYVAKLCGRSSNLYYWHIHVFCLPDSHVCWLKHVKT